MAGDVTSLKRDVTTIIQLLRETHNLTKSDVTSMYNADTQSYDVTPWESNETAPDVHDEKRPKLWKSTCTCTCTCI